MVIDLKYLTSDQTRKLNKISDSVRTEFIEYFDTCLDINNGNLKYGFSGISSKDLYVTDIFLQSVVVVFLIQTIVENENIEKIVVYNRGTSKTIKDWCKENGYNTTIVCFDSRSKLLLKRLKTTIHLVLYLIIGIFWIRNDKFKVFKNVILLDTFILENSIQEGNYVDRWYTGIQNYFTSSKTYKYLPSFGISPLKKRRLYKKIINKDDFIFLENYLSGIDYFKAVKNTLFSSFKTPDFFLNKINLNPLLKFEIANSRVNLSTYHAWINYFFLKAFKKSKCTIEQIIDWNENQLIDKALSRGIHDFFPETKIIAYRGFIISEQFIHAIPTKGEAKWGYSADEYFVIGKGLIELLKEFNSGLVSKVAPAFRYSHVFKKRQFYPSYELQVAIALPIDLDLSIQLVNDVISLSSHLPNVSKFVIKPHPNYKPDSIKKYFDKWDSRFFFTDSDLNTLLEYSNILITTMSSSAMESLSKGIPTLIKCNNSELYKLPIPLNVNSVLWKLCLSNEELISSFLQLINLDSAIIENESQKIRNEYFQIVNEDSVYNFINI